MEFDLCTLNRDAARQADEMLNELSNEHCFDRDELTAYICYVFFQMLGGLLCSFLSCVEICKHQFVVFNVCSTVCCLAVIMLTSSYTVALCHINLTEYNQLSVKYTNWK